jgi:hypothetical protein
MLIIINNKLNLFRCATSFADLRTGLIGVDFCLLYIHKAMLNEASRAEKRKVKNK